MDYVNTCIKILEKALCSRQEGNKKFLFVVDGTDLCIEILKLGYSAIVINSMTDLSNIVNILKSANMAANNIVTIGCCKTSVNDAVRKAIDDVRYIDGWKIFESKKEYYILHPEEIKDNIERFIIEISAREQKSNIITPIRSFSDIEEKAVDWLWYPYIPLGMLTALGADPGTGKTFFCCYLAAKASRGDIDDNPFEKPIQGNILMFNSEDSPETVLKARLRKLGADMKYIFAPENVKDPNFVPYSFADERLEILFDMYKPILVFFDPIQSYLGAGVDMHRANETRPLFTRLQGLAEKYNTAIVLVSHLNKMTTQEVYYRFLGSIDFMGAVRSALFLGKHPKDRDTKVLFHIKQNGTPAGDTLAYRINNGVWVPDVVTDVSELTPEDCTGQKQRKAKTGTKKEKAIELINKAFDERSDRTNAISVVDLKKIADDNSIDWRTFERAKPQNIAVKNAGFGGNKIYFWERTEEV